LNQGVEPSLKTLQIEKGFVWDKTLLLLIQVPEKGPARTFAAAQQGQLPDRVRGKYHNAI
jgi:hypothetical protein